MSNRRLQLVAANTRLSVVTETWPPEINGVAHTINRLVQGLRAYGGYHIQLVRPRQTALEQAQHDNDFQEYLVNGLTLLLQGSPLGLPAIPRPETLVEKAPP